MEFCVVKKLCVSLKKKTKKNRRGGVKDREREKMVRVVSGWDREALGGQKKEGRESGLVLCDARSNQTDDRAEGQVNYCGTTVECLI